MPSHSIEHILHYTPRQLYDLVADIESYPEFIPWCEAARVLKREEDVVLADMVVRFKGIGGKYTSRVFFHEKEYKISVEMADGPFKYLYQRWQFSEVAEGTRVEFYIDFSMRSVIMERIIDIMFQSACEKMMTAFIGRAGVLYS